MTDRVLKFHGNPTLETERLILRKLTEEDAKDVFEYAKDPEVARYVTWDKHNSTEDAISFIRSAIEKYAREETGEWGIELKEKGKIIGALGFVQYDCANSCSTIGYVLAKDYWGRGIATEAVREIIRFGFEKMGLNRIEALHIPENIASGRVMQKGGMSYEGLLRQRMYAKGRYWDVKQYAIVKEDWVSANNISEDKKGGNSIG